MQRWLDTIESYFGKQYEDAPNSYVDRGGIRVYRPNHGIAHSLRQAFLTRDIIIALQNCNEYKSWINQELQDDNFVIKMMITASFQRSGRQSECSSDSVKYYEYERKDVENALNFMLNSDIFSHDEAKLYSSSIPWSNNNNNNISKIIHVAHLLDLRRIVGFDMQRIKKQISDMLCPCIFDELWNKSGEYLSITGDRDMMTSKKYYSDVFFTNNATKIYNSLFQ
jgi:hypothetical protein